jgi:hypothetical protein
MAGRSLLRRRRSALDYSAIEEEEITLATKSQKILKQINCYCWAITPISQSRIREEIRMIANFDAVAQHRR